MTYLTNLIEKYRYAICAGIVIGVVIGVLPKEVVSPVLIVFIGLLVGIFLILLDKEQENHNFLIAIFISAFLLRVIFALFLFDFNFLLKGEALSGDGLYYSENGYSILQMWLNGIRDFDKIRENMLMITLSGTVGNYDFWNAIVYFFTGKSPLSLIFINCLAVSLTAIFVYYITRQLCSRRAAKFTVVLTAFWPSLFLWSIQNLKEPITIFLITALIWSIVRLKKQIRLHLLFLVIVLSLLLKEFRGIFFFIFLVTLLISLWMSLWKSRRGKFVSLTALFVFISLLNINWIRMHLMTILPVTIGKGDSLLDWMYAMRTFRAYGGSAFLVGWNFTSSLSLMFFVPFALIVAWLAPFPWQLGSMSQIMAVPEMLIYYLLIPFMFSGIRFIMRYKINEGGIIVVYIFIMMFVLAFIEGNMGTLFRHRTMILPFMFILAGIGLEQKKISVKI